jgi:hypothetical protein
MVPGWLKEFVAETGTSVQMLKLKIVAESA